jgi:serine phosphatase RsbU (regulator of sigma subunit)
MIPIPNSSLDEHWIAIKQRNCAAGGGDCVRVVTQRDGLILFFVGDVAGHDARSAQLARELDTQDLTLAGALRPGILLSTLSAIVEARWPSDVFVCAVCFAIDPLTGEASIATAGQLPPIVKSLSSASPLEVQGGPPLGVMATHRYAEEAFKLEPDEILVTVTDGITDPLAEGNDPLGMSALGELVDRAPSDPTDVCRALMEAARSLGLRDDATVLAIAPALRDIPISGFAGLAEPSLAA